MKKKRLITKTQTFYLSIMLILIFVGILVFLEYNKTLNRDPSDPLGQVWGISGEDFETSLLILFIISNIFYFSVIAVVTGRSQEYFLGQSALISSFLKDYDSIFYIELHDNKADDKVESYHFSDIFLKIFDSPNVGKYFADIVKYLAEKVVVPEDRERFIAETKREVIMPSLEHYDTYFTNFRAKIGDEVLLYQIKFIFDTDSTKKYRGMICGIRCIENEMSAEKRFYESFDEKVEEKTQEIKEQNLMLNKVNENIVELLGSVIESRNPEDRGHIRNVKGYARILAVQVAEDYPEYMLTPAKIDILSSACALHDLGKIKIPYEVLYKAEKFTEEEDKLVRSHTLEGKNILNVYNPGWSDSYQKICSDICIAHHERFDGSGYPNGLEGENIPIAAQIVSISDCFDVLVSKRTYREGYPIDEALRKIYDGECGAFNPKLIESLKKAEASFIEFAENPEAFSNINKIVHTNYNILSNINILLADDDMVTGNYSRQLLESNGANVTLVTNGKLAAETFINEPSSYDVILMDIDMPIMDGISATALIRSSGMQQSDTVPIIALLNDVDENLILKCSNAGMNTHLTRPLVITSAASTIYDSINCQSKELQKKLTSVIKAANRDPLTGVKTKILYFDEINRINDLIKSGKKIDFGVVVFDLNNLKTVNDTLGHSLGDVYIRNACRLICKVYDHSPVFRIGGDEFAAILTDDDFANREQLAELFCERVKSAEQIDEIKDGRTSVAYGMSVFIPAMDLLFSDVFNRADQELYKNKAEMKKKVSN